jgi:hypothetical protein
LAHPEVFGYRLETARKLMVDHGCADAWPPVRAKAELFGRENAFSADWPSVNVFFFRKISVHIEFWIAAPGNSGTATAVACRWYAFNVAHGDGGSIPGDWPCLSPIFWTAGMDL